jgi:hypothetical protein
MNAAKYTPAPWQINDRDPLQICDASDVRGCAPIAQMAMADGWIYAEAVANAKRIVQCVNHYDDLVAMLRNISLSSRHTFAGEVSDMRKRMNPALRSDIEAAEQFLAAISTGSTT